MGNVIPLDDWIEHAEDTTCLCGPEIEIVNGEMLVIHNSIDGREELERAGVRTGKKWGLFVTKASET